MLRKISLAIFLGVLGTIFFAQHDQWVHKKIIRLLQAIAHDCLEGNFSGTIQSLSFFSPYLVLHDLEMKSVEGQNWSWRCKKCEVNCSWLQLLFKGVMDQHIIMDGFECSSEICDAQFAIENHCMAMMQKSFLPFATELKSVVFKNAHFYAEDKKRSCLLSIAFNSSSLRIGQQMKTAMSISDGEVAYGTTKYIEKINTDVSLITGYNKDLLKVNVQVAGSFLLSHLKDQAGCYLSGVWQSDHGRFSIRNAHNSLMVEPIIITEREIRINARFPISYFVQCIRNSAQTSMTRGNVYLSARIHRDESKRVEGQLVIEDVYVNKHHLCDLSKVVFTRHDDDWRIKLSVNRNNEECKGVGYWNQVTGKGELLFNNVTELSAKALPYWRVKYNNFFAHISMQDSTLAGKYCVTASNIISTTTHETHGDFSYKNGILTAHALIDENELCINSQIFPDLYIKHCVYKDKENKTLVELQQLQNNPQHIKGILSFPFVHGLVNNFLQYDLQGEGSLVVDAIISPSEITANCSLDNATIRLAHTYNFIDNFNAYCAYNIAQSSCVFENINLSLHTGTINCLRATAHFDYNGALTFLCAPLVLDRCLLNIKKDLFAIVSGNLLFAKDAHTAARVSGHIIIDKSQLKENLFSGVIQKQLFGYTHSVFCLPNNPIECDIFIETKSPIKVDTVFLQTNAQVAIRAQKNVQDPSVIGSVILHSGTLNFPYKPLFITKGIITFSDEQQLDPTIELVARNKIKKYDLSLQVEGSLLNHQIVLGSMPLLSEEQIVGLLLVGSEENSLNSMMPALIVQNLKNLIFSNNQSTFLDKYFKPILRTFNINLVPSFTDQTGRGGLRGALEITIDDRWKAVIQKNFSLTEDTKFELEFFLSDDITLRAIRDERRDIGGEVEMRWKF